MLVVSLSIFPNIYQEALNSMSYCLAVSGSAGTGKSTLAERLANRLDLPYVDEGFRRRLEAGLDPHLLSRQEMRDLILELYREAMNELDDACEIHGGFVADRCSIDYLAFWLHYGFSTEEDLTAKLYSKSRQDLNRYDYIVMLPWGVFEIEDDGRRANNKWLQLKFQSLLEGLAYRLIERQKIHWVPKEAMDVNDRVNLVFDYLEK